jgi:hypothetical protein
MDEALPARVEAQLEAGQQAKELGNRLYVFALQFLSIIIDSLFLGGCVVINWTADRYIFARFPLQGINSVTLQTLEGVFSISTFFTVLVYVIVDMIGIYRRARLTLFGHKQDGEEKSGLTIIRL